MRILSNKPATLSCLVKTLTPLLPHVKDPKVAVVSALSKLKLAGNIKCENSLWKICHNTPYARGGARHGAGRKPRIERLAVLTLKLEKDVVDKFKNLADRANETQASMFILLVNAALKLQTPTCSTELGDSLLTDGANEKSPSL